MVILSYEMWFVANMSKSSLVKTLFLRLGLRPDIYRDVYIAQGFAKINTWKSSLVNSCMKVVYGRNQICY